MPSPSDIARWIREEHAKAFDLIAQLTEHVAAIPRTNIEPWLRELKEEFERFRAHMQQHFALEEEGGYLTAVLQIRPALQPEVDAFTVEHRQLSQIMTSVNAEVAGLEPSQTLHIRDVCARIRNIIAMLEQHEDHENNLVSHVFTQDVGSHD